MNLSEMGITGARLDGVLVIDAHTHCGPGAEMDWDTSIGRFVQHMDRIGIDTTILAPMVSGEGLSLQQYNDLVYEYITAHPDRFRGYCWITPQYPENMQGELTRCFDQMGFVGIKIHNSYSKYRYDGARYEPMFEFANARGIPILAHTFGDDSVTQLAALAQKYPAIPFLVAHAGAGDFDSTIEHAKQVPNLYLELAYSYGTPYIIERMVREVGADRVIWGSDSIFISSANQIGKVLCADISEDDKLKVLGKNARRIFRFI